MENNTQHAIMLMSLTHFVALILFFILITYSTLHTTVDIDIFIEFSVIILLLEYE